MKHKTPKQIEKEITAIEKGEPRTWGATSLLLDAIDHTGFWHRDSDSFTSWLDKNASRFGVKPAMLWRILAAGRFTSQIRESLINKQIHVPELCDLPDKVSPESIELLAKIERAIPDDLFPKLAQKVFSGEVKRAELRSTWQTYRPALAGKTARGRGVPIPRLNPDDPDQYNSLMEAVVLDALKASGSSWSGHKKPKLYQVFLHVTPDDCKKSLRNYMFSAVAVIRPMDGEIEYHGFKYNPIGPIKNTSRGCPEAEYCDFLWYMMPQRPLGSSLVKADIHDYAGLIQLKDGKVEILKKANSSEDLGRKREKLISALFSRSLEGI